VYKLGLWLDWKGSQRLNWIVGQFLLESIKDRFVECVTMFTVQSTGLIWVGSVE
jgi:hypothetical protein